MERCLPVHDSGLEEKEFTTLSPWKDVPIVRFSNEASVVSCPFTSMSQNRTNQLKFGDTNSFGIDDIYFELPTALKW